MMKTSRRVRRRRANTNKNNRSKVPSAETPAVSNARPNSPAVTDDEDPKPDWINEPPTQIVRMYCEDNKGIVQCALMPLGGPVVGIKLQAPNFRMWDPKTVILVLNAYFDSETLHLELCDILRPTTARIKRIFHCFLVLFPSVRNFIGGMRYAGKVMLKKRNLTIRGKARVRFYLYVQAFRNFLVIDGPMNFSDMEIMDFLLPTPLRVLKHLSTLAQLLEFRVAVSRCPDRMLIAELEYEQRWIEFTADIKIVVEHEKFEPDDLLLKIRPGDRCMVQPVVPEDTLKSLVQNAVLTKLLHVERRVMRFNQSNLLFLVIDIPYSMCPTIWNVHCSCRSCFLRNLSEIWWRKFTSTSPEDLEKVPSIEWVGMKERVERELGKKAEDFRNGRVSDEHLAKARRISQLFRGVFKELNRPGGYRLVRDHLGRMSVETDVNRIHRILGSLEKADKEQRKRSKQPIEQHVVGKKEMAKESDENAGRSPVAHEETLIGVSFDLIIGGAMIPWYDRPTWMLEGADEQAVPRIFHDLGFQVFPHPVDWDAYRRLAWEVMPSADRDDFTRIAIFCDLSKIQWGLDWKNFERNLAPHLEWSVFKRFGFAQSPIPLYRVDKWESYPLFAATYLRNYAGVD